MPHYNNTGGRSMPFSSGVQNRSSQPFFSGAASTSYRGQPSHAPYRRQSGRVLPTSMTNKSLRFSRPQTTSTMSRRLPVTQSRFSTGGQSRSPTTTTGYAQMHRRQRAEGEPIMDMMNPFSEPEGPAQIDYEASDNPTDSVTGGTEDFPEGETGETFPIQSGETVMIEECRLEPEMTGEMTVMPMGGGEGIVMTNMMPGEGGGGIYRPDKVLDAEVHDMEMVEERREMNWMRHAHRWLMAVLMYVVFPVQKTVDQLVRRLPPFAFFVLPAAVFWSFMWNSNEYLMQEYTRMTMAWQWMPPASLFGFLFGCMLFCLGYVGYELEKVTKFVPEDELETSIQWKLHMILRHWCYIVILIPFGGYCMRKNMFGCMILHSIWILVLSACILKKLHRLVRTTGIYLGGHTLKAMKFVVFFWLFVATQDVVLRFYATPVF